MLHVTHPKLAFRHVLRRSAPLARDRVGVPPAHADSNAAPLTLALIVVMDLLLAATVAIVGALGG